MFKSRPYQRDTQKTKFGKGLRKLLLIQFWDFKSYYLGAFLALIITHYIQSTLPFLAKKLADLVTIGHPPPVAIFFWSALGIIIFRTLSRLMFFYPARVMERDMRMDLMTRLEVAPPVRYKKYSAGQIFQFLVNDTEQLRALVGFALLQLGNVVVAMAILIPRLWDFHPSLLVAMTPIFISFVLFTIIVGKTRHYHRKTMDLQGELQNCIIESYQARKTIKTYQQEQAVLNLFSKVSYRELWNFYKAGVGISFSIPILPLGIGLSLVWGAHIIYTQSLGASALIVLSGFIFLFMEPLMFVAWVGVVFVSSWVSWKRLDEFVTSLDTVDPHEEKLRLMNQSLGDCDFEVEYWDSPLLIQVPKQKWTVFASKTGHGKSVVLFQLAEILMMRGEKMSLVSQSPYLYNDTLRNNIFMGRMISQVDEELATSFLKLMGLDYLTAGDDELLDLEVGENGKRLSGGQAKRVCLVRSLLSNADWFLWDDPFSSVDVIFEKKIIERLKQLPLLTGKTLVITTHRITTARAADRILLLEKSQGIVEQGDAYKLNSNQGEIYEHFQKQMVTNISLS